MSLAIERGQQARMELRETEAAFEYVRQEIFNEITQTQDEDTTKREILFRELRALDKVKGRLQAVVGSAAVSEYVEGLHAQGFAP